MNMSWQCPTSINFSVLIDRIHRGEEAEQPLLMYECGVRSHKST